MESPEGSFQFLLLRVFVESPAVDGHILWELLKLHPLDTAAELSLALRRVSVFVKANRTEVSMICGDKE